MKQFLKEVKERFPSYKLSPLKTTNHKNIIRLSKPGTSLVAKTIWHDLSDPDGDMGIKAQDKAYETEVKILSMLPKWWGLRLIDHFKTESNRVIVTNEIETIKGKMTLKLIKQIKWLHSHKIAHNDLELKNILLTKTGPIIIDFEKSILMASKEQMQNDCKTLRKNLKIRSKKKYGDRSLSAYTRRRKVL